MDVVLVDGYTKEEVTYYRHYYGDEWQDVLHGRTQAQEPQKDEYHQMDNEQQHQQDNDALMQMLHAWYMAGYQTGYYECQQQQQQQEKSSGK